MHDIAKVTIRSKLKPRREPYWSKVTSGCFLGYRRMSTSATGTWLTRFYDADTQKQSYRSLGEFADVPEHQRYDLAMKAAREWFAHLDRGGLAEIFTVADACDRYVDHVRHRRGAKAANDVQRRLRNYVLDDPKLGAMDLTRLTPRHVEQWRSKLRERPTISGRERGGQRSDSSLNRDMTCFRAALNLALHDGIVTSDFSWRAKLKPIGGADRQRKVYLSRKDREALIFEAPCDLATLLRLMMRIPLRPGAAAQLTVGDFNKALGTLNVPNDKAGANRQIALPQDVIDFISELSRDKLPSAPIAARSNGMVWNKDAWKGPFKEAATRAGLPEGTTCYAVRHSVITDLLNEGVDSMTVARLAGTSIMMIEKHYGHLTNESARAALALLYG